MIAPIGETAEQDGVIATRPATTPEAAPSDVAWPSRIFSVSSQPSEAAPVATIVLTQTTDAELLAARAEPALKPNQPNHSRPAPVMTRVRLCGRIGSRPKPTRLPSTIARARPATPALMCTAVPPAKSITLRLLAIQPPVWVSVLKSNTQCATGKYTIVAQMPEKSIQGPNLARSAMAPEISATVMIAKTAWKATNAMTGRPPASLVVSSISPLRPKNCPPLPSRPPPTSSPNASE